MAKPVHPADIAAWKSITDTAIGFKVHHRRGPRDATFNQVWLDAAHPWQALRLARACAAAISAGAGGGRRAQVYAVLPGGRAEFVPDHYLMSRRSRLVK